MNRAFLWTFRNVAIRPIIEIGHPTLRLTASKVSDGDVAGDACQALIQDLIETMRNANGAGLAAPQIDVPLRVCVMEVQADNPRYPYKPEIPLTVLINPVISPLGTETFNNYEGCLSVPNLRGLVPRHLRIGLSFLDPRGQRHDQELFGLAAGTVQHEVDHLDGLLFVDRVEDESSLCTWENFERYHRDAFIESIQPLIAENPQSI